MRGCLNKWVVAFGNESVFIPHSMNPFHSISYALLFTSIFAFGKETRPNFIFLFTDDQVSYSLGCFWNKDVKTPRIDSLSEAGMTFDHHYDVELFRK